MTDVEKGSLPGRWFVLFLLLLIFIFNYADRFLISGLVGTIKAEFGLGDSFMGLLMGPAFVVLYVLGGIPIARLADRRSRGAIIGVGCLVWSLFTGMTGLAVGPISLALCRVGVGIGEAALLAPAYSLLSDYFPPQKRGIAFSVLGLATYFGQIGGYALGPAIAHSFGWQVAFFAMGVPGMVLGIIALFALREPYARINVAKPEGLVRIVRRMAGVKSYLALMIGMGLGTLSGVSFGFWGPTLFVRNHGVSEAAASNAFALFFGLSGLTGMLIFGAVSDRLAARGPAGPPRLAAASLFAATLCILLVTWSDDFTRSKLLAIPSGLLGGGWSVGVMASLQFLLPDRYRATATASFVAVTTLIGLLAGPWLAGTMSEWFGDGAHSLRLGLSVTIPAGFVAAVFLWSAAQDLAGERNMLAALEA
ncbi:MAG: MFS transporter [Sphingomonadaceae bacterium]